ncbi:MAG: hypothetical protein RLZZ527_494 [Actinomycetota bacterium]
MASENPPLIWIDCEMTGLSIVNDALVEIAVLATDSELNVLGDGIGLVIKTDETRLAKMSDEVRTMHTESGLINEIPNGVSLQEAESKVLEYLAQFTAPGKSPLAGNSVGMDRNFIDRDMPQLGKFLHYRTVDVSSIKELARRWYPKIYFGAPKKTGNHRALGDIKDSIEELKYYRSAIFLSNS